MLKLVKRREVKALLREGCSPSGVAEATGVSLSSVKRISKEPDVEHLDDAAERCRRRIGRPSKIREFRDLVVELVHREAGIRSTEILRRLRLLGYDGGRTALYALVEGILTERTPAKARPAASQQIRPGVARRSAGGVARG